MKFAWRMKRASSICRPHTRLKRGRKSAMRTSLTILFPIVLTTALAQDTGTAHKAAATALLNSNNTGAARLACPATIGPIPTANSPAGPGRAGGPPPAGAGAAKGGGRGPAATPAKETWYAEGGQVFD